MGKYLDIFRSVAVAEVEPVAHKACHGYDINDLNDKRGAGGGREGTFGRFHRFCRTLHELEHRCPDYIDAADWQQAIEDGRRFVSQWGEQAEALGWVDAELLGLHEPPGKPAPNYRRLSRYDQTGLIWLLRGRPVTGLTASGATIREHSGATTTYRRQNKPASGMPCDSIEVGGLP